MSKWQGSVIGNEGALESSLGSEPPELVGHVRLTPCAFPTRRQMRMRKRSKTIALTLYKGADFVGKIDTSFR